MPRFTGKDIEVFPFESPAIPSRNKLLAALPRSDFERLAPFLKPVSLTPRRVLFHARTPIEHVYFVEEGLVSVLAQIDEQRAVEVWLIGREGMAGLPVVLGGNLSPHRRVVQLGGSALRIRANDLRRAMDEIASVRKLLLRYVQLVIVQASQSGACNSSHTVQQRLARWLLAAQDRREQDLLPLTHEMLSRMLGVRRASVTECITFLERQGVLSHIRGVIKILARGTLESMSCGCYRIMKVEYERMQREFASDNGLASRIANRQMGIGRFSTSI
jgi:CRP-like cAMP-binding protein